MSIIQEFYLRSFVARAPKGTQPLTEFGNGQPIELSWDSNGTYFELYAGHEDKPIYGGTERTFVVPGGRPAATTFTLAASVAGGVETNPRPGFETVYLYAALTITIRDPDLTPHSVTAGTLTVSQSSTLKGDATLTGGARVEGDLSVGGAANVGSLQVNGPATLNGTVALGSTTVNGVLTAGGSASLGAATAASLSVLNSVSMMSPRAVNPGTQVASTDGLLAGSIYTGFEANRRSLGWITGTSGGITLQATGGNTYYYGEGMCNNANSFLLPVKKGQPWTAAVQYADGNDVNPWVSFWWIPFGLNATLEVLSAEEAAAAGMAPIPTARTAEVEAFDPTGAIDELAELLAEMAGGELAPGVRERFTTALRAMVEPAAQG